MNISVCHVRPFNYLKKEVAVKKLRLLILIRESQKHFIPRLKKLLRHVYVTDCKNTSKLDKGAFENLI